MDGGGGVVGEVECGAEGGGVGHRGFSLQFITRIYRFLSTNVSGNVLVRIFTLKVESRRRKLLIVQKGLVEFWCNHTDRWLWPSSLGL